MLNNPDIAEKLDFNQTEYLDDGSTGVETEKISGEEVITRPFDPTQIRVEPKSMTIDLLVARIRENELELNPGFQRKAGIWKDGAQSRLIESLLIRIPLPAFYLDASDDDKWLVVDGLQRLTAIKRFIIDKELRLCELEFLIKHQGKFFDDLPRHFQRRILETQVTVFLIQEKTPTEVKFNIFKRINTAGLPLSPQEIRHALYQGNATKLLAELANSIVFKIATDNSIRDDRMADRESVLRFLAFSITPYTNYREADLDGFLNDAMVKINKMSNNELAHIKRQFHRTMSTIIEIFGKDAFRKIYRENHRRFPFNKALYEVWSLNLNKLPDDELKILIERKNKVIENFMKLMEDDDFEKSISSGTGEVAKVKYRFSKVEMLIREVITND